MTLDKEWRHSWMNCRVSIIIMNELSEHILIVIEMKSKWIKNHQTSVVHVPWLPELSSSLKKRENFDLNWKARSFCITRKIHHKNILNIFCKWNESCHDSMVSVINHTLPSSCSALVSSSKNYDNVIKNDW